MAPPTPWGLTSVALWRIVCLCLRLNNFTGAVPPLLLCLIIPCTFSALSRGRKRDRMDIKQHLWGMEEGVKVGVCVCVCLRAKNESCKAGTVRMRKAGGWYCG